MLLPLCRRYSDLRFAAAMAAIDRDHDRLVAETIALNEITAPPFKEDRRGAAYLEMLRQHGPADVERDEVGNVMGVRRGTAIVASLVASLAIWFAFYKLLRVPLPWGVLTPWAF